MSDLSTFVNVVIDRASKSPSQESFGIPMIAAQFAANKTTTTFSRARSYKSLKSLAADGWKTTDSVYLAAQAFFRQSNTVTNFILGRIDAADATLADSLNAIFAENSTWYGFVLIGTCTTTVKFSTDLIASNVISSTFNGIKVPDVVFSTDHASTMAAWETAIETATGGTVTVSGDSITVSKAGEDFVPVVTVAGASTQPVVTYSYTQDETKIKNAAAWTESELRVYGYDTPSFLTIGDSSKTDDLASSLKALGYDRTFGLVHRLPGEYAAASWIGEGFPYAVGSSTYAYRTLKGVTADGFDSTVEDTILNKNCSYYTETASISHTFDGKVASGEYLDSIIGIDWIRARLKERVFGHRVNVRKSPMTDSGLEAEGTIIYAVLKEAETMGILVSGTATVTVPKLSSLTDAQKTARAAVGYEFGGQLEGAIHTSDIDGHLYI